MSPTPIERAQDAEKGTYCGYGHQVIVMAKDLPEWARRKVWEFLYGEGGRFVVTVRTLTGKELPFPLPHAMYSVIALKQKLRKLEGYTVEEQDIFRPRQPFQDDRWLSDYGLGGEDCTVYCALKRIGKARTSGPSRKRPTPDEAEFKQKWADDSDEEPSKRQA